MPPSAEAMIVTYNTARRVLEATYKAVSEADPSSVGWERLRDEWCRAGKISQIREGQLRLHAERLERMRSDARHTGTYTDHMGVTHTSQGPQVCTYDPEKVDVGVMIPLVVLKDRP